MASRGEVAEYERPGPSPGDVQVAGRPRLSMGEFIPMMALLMSLTAMSIDAMLPALGLIASELDVANANDVQFVISGLFLGMAVGQVMVGPLSDGLGRKPAIYIALSVFMVGSVLCLVARSFTAVLVGRVLQGIGSSGPRIVCMAVIRDQYAGRSMARVMSIILSVFILVPALAPAIGQGILFVASWRAIFAFLLLQALVSCLWFGIRQAETLAPEKRLPIALGRIARAAAETCTNRISFGYTITAGLIFGAFIGYLSTAQQIFQGQYGVGELFPLYFGVLALCIGGAMVLNSRLVMRLGMRVLCVRSVSSMAGLSLCFALIAYAQDGHPPLWQLMVYLGLTFFAAGVLFGNFNALAMEPMGHIAGTAAAVIGSLTTIISLLFGVGIGRAYDGTVLPLVVGYAFLGSAALVVMAWIERKPAGTPHADGA